MFWNRLLIVAVIALTSSCTTKHCPTGLRDTHENLNGVLWTQYAAEHDALCMQVYRAATDHLQPALADKQWTASPESQNGDYSTLPPAIILDLDETVLDNSPFQGDMVIERADYEPEEWKAWVAKQNAPVIAGAKAFLERADKMGIAIYYVTNRDADEREDTLQNLKKLGLPIDPDATRLATKDTAHGIGSDKTSRRAAVGANHRIIMLIGDDLNDFTFANTKTQEERATIVEQNAANWGERWFILPNSMYGSWDRALSMIDTGDSPQPPPATPQEKDARKLKHKFALVKTSE